ncbi:hypothetical protein ASF69_11385 [Rhizobium sp. Leaf311]|nr:hypothetical protein ASF69_11385 [Rhizobium sp. Leaf311]
MLGGINALSLPGAWLTKSADAKLLLPKDHKTGQSQPQDDDIKLHSLEYQTLTQLLKRQRMSVASARREFLGNLCKFYH